MACHLGVHTDLPSIGVAKKLLQVDGLENNAVHKEKVSQPAGRVARTVPAWVGPRDGHRRAPSSRVALPVNALIPALGAPCVPVGAGTSRGALRAPRAPSLLPVLGLGLQCLGQAAGSLRQAPLSPTPSQRLPPLPQLP